jgi:hypothetical protein
MIILTVFVCGAVIISFEILASRVFAPYFGNSVYVWGGLISVFLAGLSLGYYLGGKIADTWSSMKMLGVLLLVPGIFLIIIPFLSGAFMEWIFLKELDIRLSSLSASMMLCFIPTVFLGGVSPYSVKLCLKGVDAAGRTVGNLYAISTMGSIIGTLLTSFFLITFAGVKILIISHGLLLVVLSIPQFFNQNRR